MVEARIDQGGVLALGGELPPARIDQAGVLVLASVGTPTRIDQAGVNALVAITAETRIDQLGVLVLAATVPCGTRWAQIWTITRTDGEVFRFTSKDTDLEYPEGSGITYLSCDSLVPSASEEVSEVDAAGNMDLSGAIGDDGIAETDLYAGLFDGAIAEAWVVPWAGEGMPRRLLKGTFGPTEQTKTGFKVELLGDGAKLMQTPLVSTLQPGCRWKFGDPVTCGKDLAPLTVTGTVDNGTSLRSFVDAARAEAAGYFSRGVVTFTSGANAGIVREIKEHSAGGSFTLWEGLPFPLVAGVTYSMTPGCTLLKEASGGTNGCEAWGQLVRYGGFLKVPGKDKRQAAADVKSG